MRRIVTIALVMAAVLTGVVLVGERLPVFGARSSGERLERIERSPLFEKGKAQNLIDTPMGLTSDAFGAVRRYMRGGQEPKVQLPVNAPVFSTELSQAFTMTWMGHSSVLIEIEGVRVLTDPVFSKRASPFHCAVNLRNVVPHVLTHLQCGGSRVFGGRQDANQGVLFSA